MVEEDHNIDTKQVLVEFLEKSTSLFYKNNTSFRHIYFETVVFVFVSL